MFDREKFASRLRVLRSEQSISTRKLGKEINISSSAITQFEKGTSLPALDTLTSLANFFEVSTDYLLGITDNPSPLPDVGKSTFTLAELPGEDYYFSGNTNENNENKPNKDELRKLTEGLDDESVAELKKYAGYLRIRQTLDSGSDESSAGLDINYNTRGVK